VQGTWEVTITRLNREKFTDKLPQNRPPTEGEEVKCRTPAGETVLVKVVSSVDRRPPNGPGMGVWAFNALEIIPEAS
jgi:hypothetical protein